MTSRRDQSVWILSPREEEVPQPPTLFAQRPDHLSGLDVVLLGNAKLNVDVVLRELGRRLVDDYGVGSVTYLEKEVAGKPADRALLAIVRARAGAVLTGVGD